MSGYDKLAQALTRFTGKEVRAEEISSFDNFEVRDEGTDLMVKITIEEGSGNYYLYVSDYLDSVNNWSPFVTDDLEMMEEKFEVLADCIDAIYSGLKRLDRAIGQMSDQAEQLKVSTNFNRASSYYTAFLDEETFTTRDPSEMAEKLEEYYEENMNKYIDETNAKIQPYTREQFEYGTNFEAYNDGLFLSIYFNSDTDIKINFHPGKDPATWVSVECTSRKELNQSLKQIVRRIQ